MALKKNEHVSVKLSSRQNLKSPRNAIVSVIPDLDMKNATGKNLTI